MTRRPQALQLNGSPIPLAPGVIGRGLAVIALCAAAGCQTGVEDRSTTNQIPPDVRGSSHGQLGSKELLTTTDAMVESIVASLDDLKRDETGRTVIVMDRLVNKSAYPNEDFEIFIARLRSNLQQSGAKYQLTFVEDPNRSAAVRGRVLEEGLKDDYEVPGLRPHYALTGDVYAMERPDERYWMVDFRLLDLDPDARIRNELRWEDSVDFRFVR